MHALTEDVDQGFENLKKLVAYYKDDYSEADTRAKLIDPMFKDCLGWTENDITRESHVHPGYLDYIFSVGPIKKFVLEAKKTGKYFELPRSLSHRRYKITGTISTNKPLVSAIDQAQKYCVDTGVRHGVISNGNQYILFEAFRYGFSWKNTQCVVFRSLEDILRNFTSFSNILSRDSVKNGSLRKYVSQEPFLIKYEKPLDKIRNPDRKLIRNYLTPFLQPIIDFIFKDLTKESQLDILKRCYVVEKQFRRSTSSLVKAHFDRLPHYADKYHIEQLRETESEAGAFQTSFEKCKEFLKHEVPRGTLITLLGGVGTGKTTFLHHFFKCLVRKPKTLWFYVDFKESFPDPALIADHIYEGIVDDYRARYQPLLQKDLADLGFSGPEPTPQDIIIMFSILNLKGYTISIVLDNVDRHYLTVPKFQEQALLVARSITNDFKTMTILTLREESFFKSRKSGVLDAYDVPKFHIASPYFYRLIGLRIGYTLDLLGKSESEIMETLNVSTELGTKKEEIEKFFKILRYSLRGNRKVGREIVRFLCDVSGGDRREALRFINTFCVSGNTNMDEMFYIFDKQGFYDIPFHHVIKSIMLGDSRYYRSANSPVMNVFDINPSLTFSHFLHLHILSYLDKHKNHFSTLDTGYVEIDDIIFEAERVLISQKAIGGSLSTLAYYGLVEFDNQSKKGYNTATHVRITATGEYYLESLIHKFVYLDHVWVDTPLCDERLASKLGKYIKREAIEDRFERTDLFLQYLREKEKEERTNNPEFTDSDLTSTLFMDRITDHYEEEKKYIRMRRRRQLEARMDPATLT